MKMLPPVAGNGEATVQLVITNTVYHPVSHGREARATMVSWHGRPGHDTELDRFELCVHQVDLVALLGTFGTEGRKSGSRNPCPIAVRNQRRSQLFCALRARQEIRCTFCCWPPGPLARRELRAYPLRYVRSEQRSQEACGPQPGGARRRAGICGVAAPRRFHYIACVAAPCICPPGARAKMHTLFPDGP